ncbi:MAG: polysaccharide deacetylase family protein [Firmicutes bacterium]|nr:polysaccharide deacetylase family protein [Bacillota bacterium]
MRWLSFLWVALFSWFPWHHPAVSRPAPIIKQVLTTQKVVALTFDDGPTRTWTPQILKILKDNHVRATFFVIGSHAIQRPDVLKEEVDAGMEIGSHGYQHLTLRQKDSQLVKREIAQNEELFQSLGVPKPSLYRLPGGASDATALKVLGEMGYKVIGWSVDTRDWRRRFSASQLAERVMNQVEPGAIVIFHDGPNSSMATVDAVKAIIPQLKKAGWKFDTVSELLKLERLPHHAS